MANGNKSEAIREKFVELGLDASPTEVVRQLADRGVKVRLFREMRV